MRRDALARPNGPRSGVVRALLLDLDDTLLINDFEAFLADYFPLLVAKMEAVCPPAQFMGALDAGMRAMLANDGSGGTNAEVFAERFFALLECPPERVMPLLDAFYTDDFELLREHVAPDADARPLVELAFDRGYQVAIATQPVFPLSAIRARLRWAGVGAEVFPYDFVVSYETMSACKPHPYFFQSLLARLGRQPDECLMVGDSLETDMPARLLRLKTFWVNRGQSQPEEVTWDAQGNLSDLIRLIETGEIDEL